uniref:Uncharacterized protein n=1 Tax=Arundo donax TaxID=35708 RepID=A0A0A8ZS24_ARUDO
MLCHQLGPFRTCNRTYVWLAVGLSRCLRFKHQNWNAVNVLSPLLMH